MNNIYIVANWKMNGDQTFNDQLLFSIKQNINNNDSARMIICPSMPYLELVNRNLPNYIAIGAQNISQYDNGAFTGETSGKMLADLNIDYVIIGHSERRELYNEDNIDSIIKNNTWEDLKELISADEPIWAIGTGQTATTEIAEEVHSFIRNMLLNVDSDLAINTPILYGGSVNSENADKLFRMKNIDGALIGGASLKGDEFSKIYNIAGELTNE